MEANRFDNADPMLPQPREIRKVVRENDDTFTLTLDRTDGTTPFAPGQFNMLYVFGVGEVAISISGDPATSERLVHTTRGVGTVTLAMSRLRRGDTIGVRGPFGTPWPLERAGGRDVVLVAGGIGLAPLRPVLYEIARRRGDFGRVVLLYGARSPADLLFQRDLERWRSAADIDVHCTVDHATRTWPGNVGVVTSLMGRAPFDPRHAVAFVCGPEVMMRLVALALENRGVDGDGIFVSMERNMKCAVGFCGHCQFGPAFVCKDGPVFPYSRIRKLLEAREV